MKLSVSLPNEDVDFLDSYADMQGIDSRSAVVHRAIRMLRIAQLGASYEEAYAEWEEGDDAGAWDSTVSDGMSPDATG